MLKVLELFAGIGACSKALENLGIEHEVVDAVEIDKYAIKSYNAIHGTNFEPQDITKWDKNLDIDIIFHGSPCQDFSAAGLQKGGDQGSGTRSSLMYETIRIVGKLRPEYVVWENVKNLLSNKHIHNFNAYLETMNGLGYINYYKVLDAKNYGIPQHRERVFTVSIRRDSVANEFKFPESIELTKQLKDLLEDSVDESFYLSNKMVEYISKPGTKTFRNPECKINLDVARPLTTDQNKRAGTTNYWCNELPANYDLNEAKRLYGVFDKNGQKHQVGSVWDVNGLTGGGNVPLVNDPPRIRKLTPKECFRIMGFTDEDADKALAINSKTQVYKQAGNSIVVPVIQAILKNLLKGEQK